MIDTSPLRRRLLDLAVAGRLTGDFRGDATGRAARPRAAESAECGVRRAECFSRGDRENVENGDPLPTGWRMVRLGDVVDVLDSQRKPITKRYRVSGSIPYYGATCVQDYVNDFIFDEPLVLLGEDGAKWGSGDKSAYLIEGKSWVNNHAHVLRPHAELDHKWLVYALEHSDLSDFITGTTVPKLNQENMRLIPLPLPPLSEQKEIVRRLEGMLARERGIAEDSAALDALVAAAKRKILQLAVSGKLIGRGDRENVERETTDFTDRTDGRAARPRAAALTRPLDGEGCFCRGDRENGENGDALPAGWKMVRLGEISRAIGTKQHQVQAREIKQTGACPVVSQGRGLIDGYTDASEKAISDVPLILFGDHTKNVKYIDFPFVVGADGAKLFVPLDGVDAKWLYYWTLDAVNKIGDRGYGRHWGLLQKLEIPLPPLAEQNAIVAKVDELFSLLDAMKG